LSTKHLGVAEELYFDQATGPASNGAAYLLPWTWIGGSITKTVNYEAVIFPYVPLNKAARVQLVVERVVVRKDIGKTSRIGIGYGAYQYGDGPLQNKPFVSVAHDFKTVGSFELWLQRIPGNHAQGQIRWSKTWKKVKK